MRRVAQQVLPCAAGARPLTAVGQVNVERVTGIDIANKTISTQGHIFTCHPRFPSHSGFVKNFRQCATDEIQTGICASELIAVMRMSFLHTSHVVVPTVDNPCHFFTHLLVDSLVAVLTLTFCVFILRFLLSGD